MKKTKEINDELSIDEKRKRLLEAIERQSVGFNKKDELLKPYIDEINLMAKKKLSLNSQLKALNSAGIKVCYRTYKNFLGGLDTAAPDLAIPEKIITVVKIAEKPAEKKVTVILTDKGAVKTFAVKDDIKKLGFVWDKDKKAWKKEVNSSELEKVKELKVGYDIIK